MANDSACVARLLSDRGTNSDASIQARVVEGATTAPSMCSPSDYGREDGDVILRLDGQRLTGCQMLLVASWTARLFGISLSAQRW